MQKIYEVVDPNGTSLGMYSWDEIQERFSRERREREGVSTALGVGWVYPPSGNVVVLNDCGKKPNKPSGQSTKYGEREKRVENSKSNEPKAVERPGTYKVINTDGTSVGAFSAQDLLSTFSMEKRFHDGESTCLTEGFNIENFVPGERVYLREYSPEYKLGVLAGNSSSRVMAGYSLVYSFDGDLLGSFSWSEMKELFGAQWDYANGVFYLKSSDVHKRPYSIDIDGDHLASLTLIEFAAVQKELPEGMLSHVKSRTYELHIDWMSVTLSARRTIKRLMLNDFPKAIERYGDQMPRWRSGKAYCNEVVDCDGKILGRITDSQLKELEEVFPKELLYDMRSGRKRLVVRFSDIESSIRNVILQDLKVHFIRTVQDYLDVLLEAVPVRIFCSDTLVALLSHDQENEIEEFLTSDVVKQDSPWTYLIPIQSKWLEDYDLPVGIGKRTDCRPVLLACLQVAGAHELTDTDFNWREWETQNLVNKDANASTQGRGLTIDGDWAVRVRGILFGWDESVVDHVIQKMLTTPFRDLEKEVVLEVQTHPSLYAGLRSDKILKVAYALACMERRPARSSKPFTTRTWTEKAPTYAWKSKDHAAKKRTKSGMSRAGNAKHRKGEAKSLDKLPSGWQGEVRKLLDGWDSEIVDYVIQRMGHMTVPVLRQAVVDEWETHPRRYTQFKKDDYLKIAYALAWRQKERPDVDWDDLMRRAHVFTFDPGCWNKAYDCEEPLEHLPFDVCIAGDVLFWYEGSGIRNKPLEPGASAHTARNLLAFVVNHCKRGKDGSRGDSFTYERMTAKAARRVNRGNEPQIVIDDDGKSRIVYGKTNSGSHVPHSGSRAGHQRRGHYRNQAYGPGYSMHKRIWIAPMYVSPSGTHYEFKPRQMHRVVLGGAEG